MKIISPNLFDKVINISFLSFLTVSVTYATLFLGFVYEKDEKTIFLLSSISILSIAMGIFLLRSINHFFLREKLPDFLHEKIEVTAGYLSLWFFIAMASVISIVLCSVFFAKDSSIVFNNNDIKRLAELFYLSLLSALIPGIMEELCYRWLLYGKIKQYTNKTTAIIISGFVFGLVHINQVEDNFSVFMLFVAAVMVSSVFCLIYEYTRTIWCGVVFHTSWDVFATGGSFFSLLTDKSDASDVITNSIFSITMNGASRWISGGDFGLECGAVALGVYTLISLSIIYLIKKDTRYLIKTKN